MQVTSRSDVAGLLRRLVAQELRSRNGLEAWDSFLRAHATLVRRLEVDLAQATGLALADFDVLAQLARAGGELRMTDLADRVLVSRSGMTRRVARLVEERPRAASPRRCGRTWCRRRTDRRRLGAPHRGRSGPSARGLGAVRRATRRSGA